MTYIYVRRIFFKKAFKKNKLFSCNYDNFYKQAKNQESQENFKAINITFISITFRLIK